MATKNRPASTEIPKALTANRLDDGLVVFLTGDGGWSRHLGDARLADTGETEATLADAGEKAVGACRVVGPYFIDVEPNGGSHRPRRFRERVRAYGPTVLEGAG